MHRYQIGLIVFYLHIWRDLMQLRMDVQRNDWYFSGIAMLKLKLAKRLHLLEFHLE